MKKITHHLQTRHNLDKEQYLENHPLIEEGEQIKVQLKDTVYSTVYRSLRTIHSSMRWLNVAFFSIVNLCKRTYIVEM